MNFSFESIIIFLAGGVTGAFLELGISVVFEDYVRSLYKRIRRKYLWFLSRFQDVEFLYDRELFQIGKWKANCIVLEGTSSEPYRIGNIVCRLDQALLQLPDDLQHLRSEIDAQQIKIKEQKGFANFFNGPMVAFTDYSYSRTVANEDALLFLRFKLTDYYSFLATAMSLNKTLPASNISDLSTTVRDKYLRGTDYKSPVPFIATSFGINLCVITKDGYLILAKRGHHGMSSYRGDFAVPVCESLNPLADKDKDGSLDIFKAAQRGAREELGISVDENEIRFFSLQVDTNWYLYGLSGVIVSEKYTQSDIVSIRSVGIKDKWETDNLQFIKFNPKQIASFIRDMGGPSKLNPSSFVSVTQTLIYEYGHKTVENAFKVLPEM
jgi:hypothetical protein